MKTQEHALISLFYAGSVALLAGQGLTDLGIYIAAVLGGEVLDFVDHPLYHLVYRRDEPHVKEARRRLLKEGLKSAMFYLKQVEDKREFKGLLLHNIYALILVSLLCIMFSLFLPGSVYWFVFLGAMLLHMLSDVYSDFWILGHADNWLWVINETLLQRWGKMGSKLVGGVLLWIIIILSGFLIITIRWGWQLANPSSFVGLYLEAYRSGNIWLNYAPLLVLVFYLSLVVVICLAAVRKYDLELERDKYSKHIAFSVGSMKLLWKILNGKIQWSRQNFERVFLRIQVDQAAWVVFLAILIALVLLILNWLHLDSNLLLFLTPIFFALLFGTFIHTTVGEFGGVFGVLLAWLLNLALAHLNLQTIWPISRGYLLFGAAVVAWIVGLIGTIFLRGKTRMSMAVFFIEVDVKGEVSSSEDGGLRKVLDLSEMGLQNGFAQIHSQLFGNSNGCNFVHSTPINLLLTPYTGRPIMGIDHYHLQATDSYVPMLREMAYVLCSNRLMKYNNDIGEYGLLPVMPRYRTLGSDLHAGDMHYSNGSYQWHSIYRPLTLEGSEITTPTNPTTPCLLLTKTWGEFVDHFVTRSSCFQTDLFIYTKSKSSEASNSSSIITLCGLTYESTSTKDYATVEAEAYAGAVMRALIKEIRANPELCLVKHTSVRLFYPQVSIFDQELVNPIQRMAVLPSDRGMLSTHDLELMHQSLDALSVKNPLPNVTADFGKKLGIWGVQMGVTTLLAIFGFDPKITQIISDLLSKL